MSGVNLNNMEKGPFIKESIRILHEAYKSRKLVLFVGAGVDVDSGLPLWSDAIKKFCAYMNLSDKDTDNLRIPQYYYNSRGKKEYVELCRDIFCFNRELEINDIHKKIVDFNVNTIITTNYTNFLEREMTDRGYIYRTICQDRDLVYTKNENLIIKMHGDFEHGNFVLKEDDYLNYSKNFRLIETFVKSIIAKNVVLLIGYSFSDPDVKQLFSWVKDILGNDFQQAYMLEGFKDYDENVFDYYKNLGVNILYIKKFNENRKSALLTAMDMIEKGYEGELSKIDLTSNYFSSCLNLNYILAKYVNKGLQKLNLIVDAGVLKSIVHKGNNEENYLLEKLSKQITEKIDTKDDSYNEIVNVILKSGIEEIEILDWNKNSKIKKKIQISQEENQLFNSIFFFDYNQIKEYIEEDSLANNEKDAEFYLKQAYMYYVLNENVKAYTALCTAATLFFRKHQYYKYYIAQFNKFRIGTFIKYDYKVSDNVRQKVEKDLEKIDLDKIIRDIPDLSYDNQILKDIGSFQVHYTQFLNAYKVSEKVKKQQNTVYSFFAGTPDYISLHWMIKDYYKYLIYNYLMVDKFQESSEILKLYIKCIIDNVNTPDKEGADGILGDHSSNIHAAQINVFEIFLMIKYMMPKEIMDLMTKLDIKNIPVNEDCYKYIEIVLNNLKGNNRLTCEAELWNCLTIVSYINPTVEVAENSIDYISKNFNSYIYRTYKKVIYKLLNSCYENKKFKIKEDGIFNINNYALGRFLGNLIINAGREKDNTVNYSKIINDVLFIFHKNYGEYYNADLNCLLSGKDDLTVAMIYPFCGENNRSIIKAHFAQWKKSVSLNSCNEYYYIVSNDIGDPEEEYEQSVFSYIHSEKKKDKCNSDIVIYNNNICNDIMVSMYNLYMKNKIIQNEKFIMLVNEFGDEQLIFLSDMDAFDYDKFKLEWLNYYADELLEKIAKNKVAKCNISKKFAESMELNGVSNKLLKLYFKYFVDIS